MIYFFLYLFLEVMISTNIATYLGGLYTFFAIIFTAFIGIAILVNFRKNLLENMSAVSYTCIDLQQFQKLNLFTLFGAILLIVPGFLTDILGITLQFSAVTSILVNRYNVESNKYTSSNEDKHVKKDINVIDVEIINDKPILK